MRVRDKFPDNLGSYVFLPGTLQGPDFLNLFRWKEESDFWSSMENVPFILSFDSEE